MVEHAVSEYKSCWGDGGTLSNLQGEQFKMTLMVHSSVFSAMKHCSTIAVTLMKKWGILG
jgi:hypothetical protein